MVWAADKLEGKGSWNDRITQPPQDGVGYPCLTPRAIARCPLTLPVFDKSSAIVVNHPMKSLKKCGEACLVKNNNYPPTVHTGLSARKFCQQDARIPRHACRLGKGQSFDLKNVVRHLPGGDASLSW